MFSTCICLVVPVIQYAIIHNDTNNFFMQFTVGTVVSFLTYREVLTHLPLIPHICVSKLGRHFSGNGLLPVWLQAISWIRTGLLLIGLLGTNFSEILIRILSFSFKKMHLKMSSAKVAAILSRGSELRHWTWLPAYRCSSSHSQMTDIFVLYEK